MAKKSRTKKVTSGQVGENKGDHLRYNTNCMQTKTDQEQRATAYRQFKADAWECQIESLGPLRPRKQEDPRPATRASDTHLRQMSWGMLSSCLDHHQSSEKKVLGGQLQGNFLQFPRLPVIARSGFLVACCCPCLIYSAGILCLAKTDVSLLCVCL